MKNVLINREKGILEALYRVDLDSEYCSHVNLLL